MEIAYSGDAFHTYMVIDGKEWKNNEDEEKMMSNQSSRVLLPFQIQQLNEEKKYYYDISGRLEFRSYIEKQQADQRMIRSVLMFIVGLNQAIEEYLLDPDGILLKPECLYLEMPEGNLKAAYIPGRKDNFFVQLKELAAWLLQNTFHGDKEGVLLAYDFYKRVQQENFLPGQLEALLIEEQLSDEKEICQESQEELIEEEEDSVVEMNFEDSDGKKKNITEKAGICLLVGAMVIIGLAYWQGLMNQGLQWLHLQLSDVSVMVVSEAGIGIAIGYRQLKKMGKTEKKEEKMRQEAQTLYEGGGVYSFTDETQDHTMILSGREGQVRFISLDKKIAGDLILDIFPCTIGSLETENQYVIPVKGVSRRHAKVEKTEKGIYLMDLASTNGTRVNGEKLQKNEKRRLMVEDMIEFAGVRFMYC